MITRRLWSTQFGSDPAVIGRGIILTGGKIVVAGVIPTDTEIFDDVDLFTPIKVNLNRNCCENPSEFLLQGLMQAISASRARRSKKISCAWGESRATRNLSSARTIFR